MADTAVAVTAIVVSGVVGPGLAAWWTRARQMDDHRQEHRRELRQVLDEGAHALGDCKRCFERIFVLSTSKVQRDSDRAQEACQSWRRALGDVRWAEDRIAIRVGDRHPVHESFVGCMKHLEDQRALAWAYERGEDLVAPLDQQARAHSAFAEARTEFVKACKSLLDST